MTKQRRGVRAAIVLSGDELLRGFISDANGAWLARQLRARGMVVSSIRVVGDVCDELVATLGELVGAGNELIITSGGLGPTHDDRTSEAVSRVSGHELQVDPAALAVVEQRVRAHGRMRTQEEIAYFTPGNIKQATLPADAEYIEPLGTAPGYVLATDRATFLVLPGPPAELRHAVERAWGLEPMRVLLERVDDAHERLVRAWGVPESAIVPVLEGVGHVDGDDTRVTVCARDGELEISVRGHDAGAVDALVAALTEAFADEVFALDDEASVDQIVGGMLQDAGQTLAVAESCTAGMLGQRLSAHAGSSEWFVGGVISYADSVKQQLLGVGADVLREHGAVSEQTARAMAHGARGATGASIGVAITGIAGPGGGTPDKPVGTVHICVDAGSATLHRARVFSGNRGMVRERSCVTALHMLRELLQTAHGADR